MFTALETWQELRPVSSEIGRPTWIESLETRRLLSGSGQIPEAAELSGPIGPAIRVELSLQVTTGKSGQLGMDSVSRSLHQQLQLLGAALEGMRLLGGLGGSMPQWDGRIGQSLFPQPGSNQGRIPRTVPPIASPDPDVSSPSRPGHDTGTVGRPAPDTTPAAPTDNPIVDPSPSSPSPAPPAEPRAPLPGQVSNQTTVPPAPVMTINEADSLFVLPAGEPAAELPMLTPVRIAADNQASATSGFEVDPLLEITRTRAFGLTYPFAARSDEGALAEWSSSGHRPSHEAGRQTNWVVRPVAEKAVTTADRPGRVYAPPRYSLAGLSQADAEMDDGVHWKQVAALVGASVLIGSYALDIQRRRRALMSNWPGIESER